MTASDVMIKLEQMNLECLMAASDVMMKLEQMSSEMFDGCF